MPSNSTPARSVLIDTLGNGSNQVSESTMLTCPYYSVGLDRMRDTPRDELQAVSFSN